MKITERKVKLMKNIIKYSNYFGITLAIFALIISGCSCSTSRPDPLAGFHWSSLANLDNNQTITDDYKSYIQKLSPVEKQNLGPYPDSFFEDATGQHAVLITIGINNQVWRHILFYDKNNKRIKVIKYVSGDYYSSTSNHSCG